MKFKRIITIALLGILAFLMVRSVQAADVVTEVVKTIAEETTKAASNETAQKLSKYVFTLTIDPVKLCQPIIHPIATYQAIKSYISLNPFKSCGITAATILLPLSYYWWVNGQSENSINLLNALTKDLDGKNANQTAAEEYASNCNMFPFVNRFGIKSLVESFYGTTSTVQRKEILEKQICKKVVY